MKVLGILPREAADFWSEFSLISAESGITVAQMFASENALTEFMKQARGQPTDGTILVISQGILEQADALNDAAAELYDVGFSVARYFDCRPSERDFSRSWVAVASETEPPALFAERLKTEAKS